MKLTVGQLTAQHIGMHIRVGECPHCRIEHPGEVCGLEALAQPLPLDDTRCMVKWHVMV